MARINYERTLHYPQACVFDLVADIERYPEFVPGCRSARVLSRDGEWLRVEQEMGIERVNWRFVTHARLQRPERIDIHTSERPFEYLEQVWRFERLGPDTTRISLEADYRLRSLLARKLATTFFDEAFRRTLAAFESEAHQRLG